MLTVLSAICILWACFTNFVLATTGVTYIPYADRAFKARKVFWGTVRDWYLLVSHLAGIAGVVYIYVTFF